MTRSLLPSLHRAALRRAAPLALLAVGGTLVLPACDTFSNPNAATETEVLASQDGLLGVVVGARREYTVGPTSCLFASVLADGLSTRGLFVINTGNAPEAGLETGRSTVSSSNSILGNAWTSCTVLLRSAKALVDNSGNATDPATAASIKMAGHFYRALSLGTLARFWTHTPDQTVTGAQYLDGQRATFQTREAALRQAVQNLRDAQAALATAGGAPSAAFTARVGTAISWPNAIQALIARYSLSLGDYDAALAAAQAASLTVKSQWTYDATNPNPIYRTAFVGTNYVGGTTPSGGPAGYGNFGLPTALAPDAADGRIAYYLGLTTTQRVSVYKADTDPVPLYLPGEMLLIQAEAYARKGDLANALVQLNRVRTKTAAQDAYGIGAGLAPFAGTTQAEILTEIYRQRQIELFLQGLRLEDSRRFGRPGPTQTNGFAAERTRTFYPFPLNERSGNNGGSGANPTPADPPDVDA